MNVPWVILLCCLMATLKSVGVNGVSINNCDGLICPKDTYCSVTSTVVDGKQQTVRTCADSGGKVFARSFSGGNAGFSGLHNNVVQSSNFVMSGGGGGCIHHSSSINGITTNTYQCNTDNGNSYYVTNTNGVYKNCTTVPVTSKNGMTTMQDHCVPMSAEDIQKVKLMEEEMKRKAEEVKQRMADMAAHNQEIQNRMVENMENMQQNLQQNMQNMLGNSMLAAGRAEDEMLQTAEDAQQRMWDMASWAQMQSQAMAQQTLYNVENMRQNMQNFGNMYW